MKKKVICKLMSIFIVIIIGATFCNLITNNYYKTTHLAAYKDKLDTLKNINGEKTIFVGGSSAAFGINAELYEKLSNKKAINMGLHAIKSYDIYLSCIEPYVKSGDIVVLQLEYFAYENNYWEYDDTGLDIAYLSEEYSRNLKLNKKLQYSFKQLLRSYTRVWDWFYITKISSLFKEDEKLYLRSSLNKYGDFFAQANMKSEYKGDFYFDCNINYDSIKNIKKYVKLYEEKGAKVYINFPPVCVRNSKEQLQEKSENVYKILKEYFGERLLEAPIDNMYNDKNYFLDTEYHLIYDESLNFTKKIYRYIEEKDI